MNHTKLEAEHCARFQSDTRGYDQIPKPDLQSYALSCGIRPYQNKPELYAQLRGLRSKIASVTIKGGNDFLMHALRKFYNTCVAVQMDKSKTNNPEAAWKAMTAKELREIARVVLIDTSSETLESMLKHDLVRVLFDKLCMATETDVVPPPPPAEQSPPPPQQQNIGPSPSAGGTNITVSPQVQCPPCVQQSSSIEAMLNAQISRLDSDLREVRTQLQDTSQLNAQLSVERDRLRQQVFDLERELKKCHDSVQRVEEERKHTIARTVGEQTQEISDLRYRLGNAGQTIQSMQTRGRQLETDIATERGQREAIVAQATQRINAFQTQANQLEAERLRLTTLNQELTNEVLRLRQNNQNGSILYTTLQSNFNKLQTDKQDIESKLRQRDQELASTRTTSLDLQTRAREREVQLETQLESKRQTAVVSAVSLDRERNMRLEAEVTRLKSALSSMEEESLRQMTRASGMVGVREQELETSLKTAEKKIREFEESQREAQTKMAKAKYQLGLKEDEVTELKTQLGLRGEDLKDVKESLDKKYKEHYDSKLRQADADIEKLEAALKQINDLKAQVSNKDLQLTKYSTELQEVKQVGIDNENFARRRVVEITDAVKKQMGDYQNQLETALLPMLENKNLQALGVEFYQQADQLTQYIRAFAKANNLISHVPAQLPPFTLLPKDSLEYLRTHAGDAQSLTHEMKHTTTEAESLQATLTRAQSENRTLAATLADTEHAVNRLNSENANLKDALETSKVLETKVSGTSRIEVLQAQAKNLMDQKLDFELANKELLRQIADLETKLQVALQQAQAQGTTGTQSDVNSFVNGLQAQLTGVQAQLAGVRDQLRDCDDERAQLRQAAIDAAGRSANTINQLTNDLRGLEQTIQTSSAVLNERNSLINDLQSRIREDEKALAQSRANVNDVNARLYEAQTAITELNSALTQSRNDSKSNLDAYNRCADETKLCAEENARLQAQIQQTPVFSTLAAQSGQAATTFSASAAARAGRAALRSGFEPSSEASADLKRQTEPLRRGGLRRSAATPTVVQTGSVSELASAAASGSQSQASVAELTRRFDVSQSATAEAAERARKSQSGGLRGGAGGQPGVEPSEVNAPQPQFMNYGILNQCIGDLFTAPYISPTTGLLHPDVDEATKARLKYAKALETCYDGIRQNPEKFRTTRARFENQGYLEKLGPNRFDIKEYADRAISPTTTTPGTYGQYLGSQQDLQNFWNPCTDLATLIPKLKLWTR